MEKIVTQKDELDEIIRSNNVTATSVGLLFHLYDYS